MLQVLFQNFFQCYLDCLSEAFFFVAYRGQTQRYMMWLLKKKGVRKLSRPISIQYHVETRVRGSLWGIPKRDHSQDSFLYTIFRFNCKQPIGLMVIQFSLWSPSPFVTSSHRLQFIFWFNPTFIFSTFHLSIYDHSPFSIHCNRKKTKRANYKWVYEL